MNHPDIVPGGPAIALQSAGRPAHPPTAERLRLLAQNNGLALYALIAGTMCLSLALFYIIKHRAFAFYDIGSDLLFNFYPVQVAEVHQLRQLHELTWSFNLGLGGYIGSAFDPIQLLAVLVPDSWQLAIRLPIYLLKLLLAGGFFFGYLRTIGFACRYAIFGALAFAFCGYNVINGQWDPNALVPVQLAAYLFFFERYLRDGNRWFATAAGFTVGCGYAFDLYTFSLLSALYVIARPAFAPTGGARAYLSALSRFAGWALLGVALTAPIQLPNLYYLLESPRVSGQYSILHNLLHQLWQLNDQMTIGAEVSAFFGKDLLGTGAGYKGWMNYFEGPSFYVGMLLLLCTTRLLGPGATAREKRMFLVALLLTSAYILWPALRFAVYGFGHRAFRLSTLWLSTGLVVVGVAGLRRTVESGPWRVGLVLTMAALFAVLALTTYLAAKAIAVAQIVRIIAFVLVYATVLWIFPIRRMPRLALSLLLPLFACELLLFSAPAMIDRAAINSDGSSPAGRYDDDTLQALAFIRARDPGQSFYRVEKTYNSVFLCDALVQGYHGIKSYFFHGSSVTRFIDSMHIKRVINSTNYIYAPMDRHQVLDLLGVRYVLARDRKLDAVPGYRLLGTTGHVNVYRNEQAHGFAQPYDDVIGESQLAKLAQPQVDSLLLQSNAVADPDPVRAELERLNQGHPTPHDGIVPFADLNLERDTRLAGKAFAARASVLLLAMPFDPGWKATLDGSTTRVFSADYGLTGLVLPPGPHDIRLDYTPPGRVLGQWLAAISLTLLILIPAALRAWRERRTAQRDVPVATGAMPSA